MRLELTEFRCEYVSNSVTSHRKHIASMSIGSDKIKRSDFQNTCPAKQLNLHFYQWY